MKLAGLPGWKAPATIADSPIREPSDPAKPGKDALHPGFLACLNVDPDLTEAQMQRRNMTLEEVCRRLSGSNLALYWEEIARIYSGVSVQAFTNGYIEALRMEALARLIARYYGLTGTNPNAADVGCGKPFDNGFKRFAERDASAKPKYKNPADSYYMLELKLAAEKIQEKIELAERLREYTLVPRDSAGRALRSLERNIC